MGFSLKRLGKDIAKGFKNPAAFAAPFVGATKAGGKLLGLGSNLEGIFGGSDGSEAFAREQFEFQKDLAKSGIRMKVEDAFSQDKVSPLVALGAQTFSPSPIGFNENSGPSLDERLGDMGQSFLQSKIMGMSEPEKNLELAYKGEQYRNLKLQNDAMDPTIPKPRSPALPSPMSPSQTDFAGGGQGDAFKVNPAAVTASSAGDPSREAGAINDYGWVRTPTGVAIVPSSDVKNRIEDQTLPEAAWALRNTHVTPPEHKPPRSMLPKGAVDWRWNKWVQEWQPYTKKKADLDMFIKYPERAFPFPRKGGK